MENSRHMNIYVEFVSLDDIGAILSQIKAQNVHIFDVDIDHGQEDRSRNPSAVLTIRLNRRQSHASVLAAISELESIRTIDEI